MKRAPIIRPRGGGLCCPRGGLLLQDVEMSHDASAAMSAEAVGPATTYEITTEDILNALRGHDERFLQALVAGHIKLLRTSWLRSQPTGWKMLRRQDLEMLEASDPSQQPFLSTDEAAAALSAGDRRIAVLSYGWLTQPHPDPYGRTVAAVRTHLERQPALVGLFWDYGSLPQKPRTAADNVNFKAALTIMCDAYASIIGTCVLQLKEIPPRPAELDGIVYVCNLRATSTSIAPSASDDRAMVETAFRDASQRVGAIELYPGENSHGNNGRAELCFATHDAAVAAVASAQFASDGAFACLAYNELEYMARGWCIMEDAVRTHIRTCTPPPRLNSLLLLSWAARVRIPSFQGDDGGARRARPRRGARLQAAERAEHHRGAQGRRHSRGRRGCDGRRRGFEQWAQPEHARGCGRTAHPQRSLCGQGRP